jgi:outer membrane protein assembly factor BamB
VALNAANVTHVRSHWQVPKNQTIYDDDFGGTPTLFTNGHGVPEVAAGNNNGKTYIWARNAIEKGPVFTFQTTSDRALAPCAFDGRYLYIVGGQTDIGGTSVPGAVRALDPTTLRFVWQRSAFAGVFAAPAVANGVVVVGNTAHALIVINAATGKTIRDITFSSGFYGPAAIANGAVFVGNLDHAVYAFHVPGVSASVLAAGDPPGSSGGALADPLLLMRSDILTPVSARPSN